MENTFKVLGQTFGLYEPEQLVEGPKVVFYLWNPFGGDPLPVSETVVTTWVIMALFLVLFAWGVKKLKVVPTKRQVVFEMMYSFFEWLVEGAMGKKLKERFLYYVGALISFIFVANNIQLIPIPVINNIAGHITIDPAFRAPTSDLNTTLALGMMTALLFVYNGIKYNGLKGYLKRFLEPFPLILPIHIISEVAKPFSIAMRLFGNIFAGAIIMTLLYMFTSKIFPSSIIVVPMHLYFDLFIGFVQSFIFTMLTMVFIVEAIGEHEEEHSH